MTVQNGASSSAGIAAFITAVVGYTVAHRVTSGPCWRGTKTKAISDANAAAAMFASKAPYRVGLLDLTVPSKKAGTAYHQVLLANDLSIERAVKSVAETLYVFLHEDKPTSTGSSSPVASRPDVRCYLSELYGHVWDICCLHRNLQLDVQILAPQGDKERNEALMRKELQVVFTRGGQGEAVNKQRIAKGLKALEFVSLDADMAVASTPCHYLEDERAHIPHFQQVVLGGTFDRLHNGHKKLLSLAASICDKKLTIGVTGTAMLSKKKNADLIGPCAERMEAVRTFLRSFAPETLELNIVEIHDAFGPTIHVADFDAIVVSSETIPGAVKINEIRREKGLKPLEVVVTRRTVSSLLSSTFMRENVPKRPTPPPPEETTGAKA